MKIVKIYGGLGNQMFQYAFARRLSSSLADEVFIDSSALEGDSVHNGFELGRLFGICLPEAREEDVDRLSVRAEGLWNRLRRKYFTKRTHVIDRKFGYQPELFDLAGDRYFEGYWQSEKYFSGMSEEIRRAFEFEPPLSERNVETLRSLRRPVASIHVRRGDYLKYPNLNICTDAYYARAIRAVSSASGIASFLVFSDDIPYCEAKLDLGGARAVFVDWNRAGDSWQDMAMMASCDCHVIANSSFSWWGAWLDPKPSKRVLAPAVWNRREIQDEDRYYSFTFGDVIPSSWERIAL